jgi:acetoin utilization protein AcuC
MTRSNIVAVYSGEELGHYGFGDEHPFGEDRMHAFWDEMHRQHLDYQVRVLAPVRASERDLKRFHSAQYIDKVRACSEVGEGLLDYGDTPAYKGVFDDACYVVGTVLEAVHRIMSNEIRRAFVPIAGLHHSMPDTAAGFCVFNDVGVAIKLLQQEYGLERIGYVDIDAHHGDGLFYPFESDPGVIFADIHEDGRYNFPQTGFAHEIGKGDAKGRKLNIPLLPLSSDRDFLRMWKDVEAFLREWNPELIIMNCGADGLDGDPLAHLHYSSRAHARAASSLCGIAEELSQGRMLAVGGGGYDLRNLGKAWTAVVKALLEAPM